MALRLITMLFAVLLIAYCVASIEIHLCFEKLGSKMESILKRCKPSSKNITFVRHGPLQESRWLTLPSGESRPLTTICTAEEPIQMLLNFPSLKMELDVRDSGEPKVHRKNLDKEVHKGGFVSKESLNSPYVYHQWVYFEKIAEWPGIVSCKSVERPESWSRLFIKPFVPHPIFFDSATPLHFFFPQDENVNNATTTIPCFGSELNGSDIIFDLTKRPLWHNLYLENRPEECMRALCVGLNQTTPFGFFHTILGITYSFETDSGCHEPTKKIIQQLKSDCSGDGIISCNDVLLRSTPNTCGNNDVRATYVLALAHLIVNGASVWREKKGESLGRNEFYKNDIGFVIHPHIDYKSDYVCTRVLTTTKKPLPISTSYIPLLRENRLDGKISISKSGIRCDVNSALVTDRWDFQLWMAPCGSVITCEMAFRRQLGLGSPVSEQKRHGKHFQNSDNSAIMHSKIISAPFENGVVGCTGVFLPNQSAPLSYVQTFDYGFRGLDNQMYLTSQNPPDGATVKLLPESSSILEAGTVHTFTCRISTFIIHPMFKFTLNYDNGTKAEYETMIVEKDNETAGWKFSKIHNDLKRNTAEISLSIVLDESVASIECSAPRMDSSKWERDFLKLEPPGQSIGVIVGITIGSLVFIILLCSLIYFFFKNLLAKKTIRSLTPEGVALFLDGVQQTATTSTEFSADQLNFPVQLRIPQSLVTLYRGKILGEGQFGKCLLGTFNGEQVAVKLPKSEADLDYFTAFLREVKIMGYVGCHENIVRLLGAVVENIEKGHCLAVLELSPDGDLLNFVRQFSLVGVSSVELKHEYVNVESLSIPQKLESLHLNRFAYQIANGMEYLAAKKVIHGDLAARNVLVFPDLALKISDFGLAKKLYSCANYSKKTNKAFPWRWMAVESLKHYTFSTLSDVWSFGMTLWEIFTLGHVPFGGTAYSDAFVDLLEQGLRPPKPPLVADSTYEFIKCCWELEPESRPNFSSCQKFFLPFMDAENEYISASQ